MANNGTHNLDVRTILFPVSDSNHCKNAFEYLLSTFATIADYLVFIHVIRPVVIDEAIANLPETNGTYMPPRYFLNRERDRRMTEAQDILSSFVDRANAEGFSLTEVKIVESYHIATSITDYASERGVTEIVIGMNRGPNVGRTEHGIGSSCLLTSPVPVVTVPYPDFG